MVGTLSLPGWGPFPLVDPAPQDEWTEFLLAFDELRRGWTREVDPESRRSLLGTFPFSKESSGTPLHNTYQSQEIYPVRHGGSGRNRGVGNRSIADRAMS